MQKYARVKKTKVLTLQDVMQYNNRLKYLI